MNQFLFALALASASDGRDWGETLRIDATALHDDIAANHPGPVNPDDPGFAARNDAQLARALRRARTAKTKADYFYAMRQYVASFNDGHLEFGVFGATPEEPRWPGFLTRYDDDGRQRVFVRDAWGPAPVGARLVGCDGKSADAVSAEIVGSILGRWEMLSQRRLFGVMTFANTTNPYVMHPARCTFNVHGTARTIALDWRSISFSALSEMMRRESPPRAIGMRILADGTRWLSLSSFDGDPASDLGKRLTALLKLLDGEGESLQAAPAIVLDLRGNGGGSSDWSYQIARKIWGDGALAAVPQANVTVMWRASAANLAAIRTAYQQRVGSGRLSAEAREWFKGSIAGLERAVAASEATWRQPSGAAPTRPPQDLPRHQLSGPVYLVTDSACMSACLDAVDLWRGLGAIHVGQETSADTLYMEVRQGNLPSGLGMISVPMKVYRGRTRGSNESVIPQRRFDGNINDTVALEAWLATLR